MNQKKIGTILSYIQMLIQMSVIIIFTPVILSYIGDAEYGVYNLSSSIVSYLTLLSLGLSGSYVRFYYKYLLNNEEKIKDLNGLYLLVFCIISIVSIIFGQIIVQNLDKILVGEFTKDEIELSSKLMKIMVINIAITFPDSVFNAYITANENFVFQKALLVLKSIFNPLLGYVFLIIGYRSIGLTFAITLVSTISILANMYYSIKKLKMKFRLKSIEFILLKEIMIFSSFIFVSMIIDQINWQVDKLIIGNIIGSVAVSMYSIGSLVNQEYIFVSSSVSSMFIPKINSIVHSEKTDYMKEITHIFARIGRIQFYLLMFIIIMYISLGKYFITNIWIGPNYVDSFYVGLILILPLTIPLIQNIGIEVQKSMNKHKFRSIVYCIIAVINVLISIPLTRRFGIIGSALGTSITTFFGNGIIMNWYYHYRIGIDILYFWKEILSISKGILIPLFLSIILYFTPIKNIRYFLFRGLIIGLVYFISIYFLSFNEYEKKLLKFSKIF